MLIGIDASRSLSASPTGTENYSRRVIGALLSAESSHRFRLYTRGLPPKGTFPETGNFDVCSIPFPRLWTHIRLSAELLSRRPDALFVPSHVLPAVRPTQSIVTVHDLGYRYFPGAHPVVDRRYLDFSTRWNAATARWVLADSEATERDLIKFYETRPDKIRVVYPGLDPEWAEVRVTADQIQDVRARHGISGDYILAVGTIHPRKNYERLVEAVANLPDDCRLVIAGKRGWLYKGLFDSIRQFNVGNRILVLDYVAPSDLPALYAGARLMVMPSLYEGFGFPVLEAQACGTPVACSNTSSLPEVAGDAAEFFSPTDVSSIREVIDRLWQDDECRNNLIARGRVNIKRFTWARAAQQILPLFSV